MVSNKIPTVYSEVSIFHNLGGEYRVNLKTNLEQIGYSLERQNVIIKKCDTWFSMAEIKFGKFSAQPHTIVKQICFPNGNVLFLSLFSLFKNWMHNVVWGCAEILPKIYTVSEGMASNNNNLLWSLFRGILQEHMWGTLSPILSLACLISQQSTMK